MPCRPNGWYWVRYKNQKWFPLEWGTCLVGSGWIDDGLVQPSGDDPDLEVGPRLIGPDQQPV